MATTDFLLRPSLQSSRNQLVGQASAAHQRSTAALPAQNFSAVYTQQQQRIEQAQQQQAQQAKQRQAAAAQDRQQAERQSAAKNTAQPRKENASANKVDSAKTKDAHTSSAHQSTNEKQDSAQDETKIEQSGKPLPQEAEHELAEGGEQLDPLFLFAMGAMPAENTEASTAVNTSASTPKGELLLSGSRVNLQQASASIDAELELEAEEDADAAELSANALKLEGSASAEKAVQLNSASGKVAELLVEKTAPDKNNAAALTESLKTAPETLLNQKAVTATEAIRSDFQPRQDSLLAAQQVRQVPGAAISMQQPGWSQQVTDKVMWMSSQNLRSAEIKLDPAELGRLEIKVSVGQEQTQVTFTSAHAGVRESLEGQMHRLREMLAQQGMQDVDVNVSDQSQQQAEAQEQQASASRATGAVADHDEETVQHVSAVQEPQHGRLGLVDDYA